MSNTTKRMLSLSLKKLLAKTTLDNITIQDITDDAEVSRKTFYYHFQDIYALLEWTLSEDCRYLLESKVKRGDWQESIVTLFEYMQENRLIILNAFHSLERDTLEHEVFSMLSPLLFDLLNAQPNFELLNDEDQRFIVSVYGLGVTGLLLRWISTDMLAPSEPLIRQLYRLASGSLDGIIQRFLATEDSPVDFPPNASVKKP